MLKFKPAPTFRATVTIPVPGDGDPLKIDFTFKHRTKSELLEFTDAQNTRDDVDTILAVASEWHGIDDPLGRESLTELFEAFHAAPRSIVTKYITELTQARLGN